MAEISVETSWVYYLFSLMGFFFVVNLPKYNEHSLNSGTVLSNTYLFNPFPLKVELHCPANKGKEAKGLILVIN